LGKSSREGNNCLATRNSTDEQTYQLQNEGKISKNGSRSIYATVQMAKKPAIKANTMETTPPLVEIAPLGTVEVEEVAAEVPVDSELPVEVAAEGPVVIVDPPIPVSVAVEEPEAVAVALPEPETVPEPEAVTEPDATPVAVTEVNGTLLVVDAVPVGVRVVPLWMHTEL